MPKLKEYLNRDIKHLPKKEENKITDIDKLVENFLLTETRINNQDIKKIQDIFKKPKNDSIVLKSYSKNYNDEESSVDIYYRNNKLSFEFNNDFDELVIFLVDYSDDLGYTSSVNSDRSTNTAYVTINMK